MKKIALGVLACFSFMILTSFTVMKDEGFTAMKDENSNFEIILNNQSNKTFIQPVKDDTQLYLPLKDLFEYMGYKVEWKNELLAIQCSTSLITIQFNSTGDFILRNGFEIPKNGGFKTINNRGMISLELAGTLLAKNIEIDTKNTKINISDKTILPYEWTNNEFVAHALGSLNGKIYTNSLEAIKENYRDGYKVFEVDLILSSDNFPVAKHDWLGLNNQYYNLNLPKDKQIGALTRNEFKLTKINNTLNTLDIVDLIKILISQKDIYIIPDVKETDPEKIKLIYKILVEIAKKYDESTLKRIIPQVFNPQMYNDLKEIYNFDSYVFALYRSNFKNSEVLDILKVSGIKAISMPENRISKDFIDTLKLNHINIFAHTINDLNKIEHFRSSGITGFYTDIISPKSYGLLSSLKIASR